MKSRTRATAVVVHNEKILCFLGVDPHDGREFHFLPGGAIDPDETATECAVRETFEETGFRIAVDSDRCIDKEYVFRWNGEDYNCLTLFYPGVLKSPLQSPRSESEPSYNRGVVWVPIAELELRFSYTPEILEAVREFVGG